MYKKQNYTIVIDLDDTIYPENDFKKSALLEISKILERLYNIKKEKTLEIFNQGGDIFQNISNYIGFPSIKESLISLSSTLEIITSFSILYLSKIFFLTPLFEAKIIFIYSF